MTIIQLAKFIVETDCYSLNIIDKQIRIEQEIKRMTDSLYFQNAAQKIALVHIEE